MKLLILLAVILLFPGCNRGPAIDKTDPHYPINISIFTQAAERQPPAGNKIFKWIEDNLNVTFTWDILVGDRNLKLGVMIAGRDLPDILQVGDRRFLDAEVLIPLCGLIEQYAPNLRKHYADAWERMKEKDGRIYVLPVWGVMHGRDQGTWYGESAFFVQ